MEPANQDHHADHYVRALTGYTVADMPSSTVRPDLSENGICNLSYL